MFESAIFWWVLAGVVVVAELLTGTFYLLMIALGLVAAAIASHLGLSLTVQIMAAAVVGAGAVVLWESIRRKRPQALPAQINPDVHMDIGQTVQVTHWNPDGTAPVRFRGAQWTAIAAASEDLGFSGEFRIRELSGSRLVIEKT